MIIFSFAVIQESIKYQIQTQKSFESTIFFPSLGVWFARVFF